MEVCETGSGTDMKMTNRQACRKLQEMKLQDVELTDQVAGHEITRVKMTDP